MKTIATWLVHIVRATRVGWSLPAAMEAGPKGQLFADLMQAQIAEKLSADRLVSYETVRDTVREAVSVLHREGTDATGEVFAKAQRLAAPLADTDPELDALSQSWIEQAMAFYDVRLGDLKSAEARLERAMADDTRLEQDFGYDLMHIGRIHTLHLWARVQAAKGDVSTALQTTDAVLIYLHGGGEDLPFGTGWSSNLAKQIRPDLASAMTCRICSEIGAIVQSMSQAEARQYLLVMPGLKQVAALGIYDEITAWRSAKLAWCEGQVYDFFESLVPALMAGRGQTCLWYTMVLDAVSVAKGLREQSGLLFAQDVAQRAEEDTADPIVLPGVIRAALRNCDAVSLSVPLIVNWPKRRFHLMCMGLPRSGTTSLFTLFRPMRAANEYAEKATIDALTGQIPGSDLATFLARRDRESALEMDAASFLHLAAPELVTQCPDAGFVLPIRPPAEWFESYLKMLLRWHDGFQAKGRTPPDWMKAYGQLLFGHFDWAEIATEDARERFMPKVAERFLGHWADATSRTLEVLPPQRRLVLHTHDLGRRRGDLAQLAGITEEHITTESHANISPPGPDILQGISRSELAQMAQEICGPAYLAASVEADAHQATV
ncbi:sulfotransferase [Ruegeria sp. EL01]|uniref:sulfotransferase n=1 Tax=Ruegeria sp. EL01 TaxID=2107578 RepID=UPI000EA81150|nr:sulfotransferase [Ruegeria sp. EL01]